MSRKQLQGIGEPLSLPKPTPKTTPRPKTCTPTTPTPAQILKNCTSTPVARPEKPIRFLMNTNQKILQVTLIISTWNFKDIVMKNQHSRNT